MPHCFYGLTVPVRGDDGRSASSLRLRRRGHGFFRCSVHHGPAGGIVRIAALAQPISARVGCHLRQRHGQQIAHCHADEIGDEILVFTEAVAGQQLQVLDQKAEQRCSRPSFCPDAPCCPHSSDLREKPRHSCRGGIARRPQGAPVLASPWFKAILG